VGECSDEDAEGDVGEEAVMKPAAGVTEDFVD
jgi:hypothetical protein